MAASSASAVAARWSASSSAARRDWAGRNGAALERKNEGGRVQENRAERETQGGWAKVRGARVPLAAMAQPRASGMRPPSVSGRKQA
eukprot:93369-Prymnesium_polylepis.1